MHEEWDSSVVYPGGTLNIYWWGCAAAHPKRGVLGTGTSQKGGVLGTGTSQKGGSYARAQAKKGGLRHGHKPKRGGGLRHGHKPKRGVLGTGTTQKRGS